MGQGQGPGPEMNEAPAVDRGLQFTTEVLQVVQTAVFFFFRR